jgi:hypothetical protein
MNAEFFAGRRLRSTHEADARTDTGAYPRMALVEVQPDFCAMQIALSETRKRAAAARPRHDDLDNLFIDRPQIPYDVYPDPTC